MKSIAVIIGVWCACLAAAESPVDEWGRLNDLAEAHVKVGDYAGAVPVYREALHVAETLGPGDPRLSATLDYLANVYSTLGMTAESERLFRRAFAIVESRGGRRNVTYGLLLLDYSTMYGNSGRMDLAEPSLREAEEILAAVLPSDDSRLAVARVSYAAIRLSRKETAGVESSLRQAIGVLSKDPAAGGIIVGSAWNAMGMLCRLENRFDEAREMFAESVQTVERANGPDHPEMVNSLNNLAVTYSELRRYADAEATFQRALAICEHRFAPDHPGYGKLLGNYASFLRKVNRKNEAKKMAERAQSILRESGRRNGVGLTIDAASFRR